MASSPGSGSCQRKISHPMFTIGPWDIHQLGTNSLKDNQMYGSFTYISSIMVNIPLKGETSVGVDIVGYGSRFNALHDGKVYLLFGRLVETAAGVYHCFIKQQLSLTIGSSPTYAGTKT
ncbi:hypothetical protein PGT21_030963 [Puccinia graminis f. sp. tritici]|uniref:Uncharacterized protein n=1 Tax=Puccinia graminis f. sp. tritici TaxID=56615 RepID=A0A5B0QZ22_PUCGR|nr:hypothetical protein PGT21_030963 [Puccinia graminis f. sp. tritici]